MWCYLLISLVLLVSFKDAKTLWCYQGGGLGYTPAQCADGVQECYKYECANKLNNDASFVTRGCGLSEQSIKNSPSNDSCAQARQVCDQLNSIGQCSICIKNHMCNEAFQTTTTISLLTLIILLFLSSL